MYQIIFAMDKIELNWSWEERLLTSVNVSIYLLIVFLQFFSFWNTSTLLNYLDSFYLKKILCVNLEEFCPTVLDIKKRENARFAYLYTTLSFALHVFRESNAYIHESNAFIHAKVSRYSSICKSFELFCRSFALFRKNYAFFRDIFV